MIVYKSTDISAPVLTGADTASVINVLRACLVDGYGTRQGAGWTMPFVNGDGTKASFKNGGSGFYLSVNGFTATAAFENMSDINTGINGFGSGQLRSYGNFVQGWILIANERYMIFANYPNQNLPVDTGYSFGNNSQYILSFGDLTPVVRGDGFCSVFNSGLYFGQSATGHYLSRKLNGDVGNVTAKYSIPYLDTKLASTKLYSGEADLLVSRILYVDINGDIRGFIEDCLVPLYKTPCPVGRQTIFDESYEAVLFSPSGGVFQLLFKVAQ